MTTLFGFPLTIVALGLTSFFTDVGSEMIFPLLPVFFSETLRASPAFLGLVEGAADAVASLLKLVAGWLADRWGRRKPLVIVGYSLASLVRPLMGLARVPWHALVIRLTDRVGKGLRSAPRDALIADVADPGQVGRAFGLHRAMDHAGAVVGPLIASALLALGWPLRQVFVSTILPGVLCVLILLTIREPVPAGSPRSDERPDPEPPPSSSPAEAGVLPIISSETMGPRPIWSIRFKLFLAILFLFYLGNSSDAFLLLRARELGLSAATIPLLWTTFHLVKLISSYGGGVLADRVSRVHLIVGGWVIYALAYLGLALAHLPGQGWMLFLFYGLFYGLTEPTEKALVKDLAPALRRGQAFGYYHFLVGVSAFPAGLLTGWLWRAFGSFWALGSGAALAAVASLLLLGWNALPG